MTCKWCHNPESMELQSTLMYLSNKCQGCMDCAKVCPREVHSFKDGLHKINRSQCNVCGACVNACFHKALYISGQLMTVGEVMQEIIKDEKYYLSSSGGVTFSGGEPTLQYQFLLDYKLDKEIHKQWTGVKSYTIMISGTNVVKNMN